jgi:hypothetical protein
MPSKHDQQPYRPTPRECAILLLLLVQTRNAEAGKDLTRVRLAEITLKRLWGRHRLHDDFLREVEDWLFRAGWALFYAGTTFAAVKTTAVEGWPRLSSKRLSDELAQVAQGQFDFDQHHGLLLGETSGDGDDD